MGATVAQSVENQTLAREQGAFLAPVGVVSNGSGLSTEGPAVAEQSGGKRDVQRFPQGEEACKQFCQQGTAAARSADCAESLPVPDEGELVQRFRSQECTDFPRAEVYVKEEFDGDSNGTCSSQTARARKGLPHLPSTRVHLSGPRYFVSDIV